MYLRGSYTIAQGSFDSVSMELPAETTEHGDYDYSAIHEYSDLEYSYYELAIGGSYRLSDSVGLFTDVEFTDLTDDQSWVYGDLSGDWYVATVGAQLQF